MSCQSVCGAGCAEGGLVADSLLARASLRIQSITAGSLRKLKRFFATAANAFCSVSCAAAVEIAVERISEISSLRERV
jgi:hypothetical protein